MHSITSYSIRCFDINLEAPKREDKYPLLGHVGKFDTYNLVKESLISVQNQNYILVEDAKQIHIVSTLECDDDKRIIKGIFENGKYGVKSDIINIKTKKVDYEKLKDHAEMIKYYFLFYIPKDQNEGIVLLQSVGNSGIKTILYDFIANKFKEKTNLNLQMNQLAYEKAFKEWADANVQEIRLNRFKAPKDIADAVDNLVHDAMTSNLTIKTKESFGKLQNYFKRNTDESNLVEIMMEDCSQVKAVAKTGNRTRVFNVNRFDTARNVCQIELDESNVTMEDGNPTYESIDNYCLELLSEQIEALYPFKR